jgi:ribosomal protein L11 methyltransferase
LQGQPLPPAVDERAKRVRDVIHHKGATVWRLAVTAPDAAAAELASAVLATACSAVSAFEAEPTGAWRIEGYATVPPTPGLIEATLAVAWTGRDDAPPALGVEHLPAHDWVALNQASFPPLAAGRYMIHGSHRRERVPPGRIGLCIDAATAFGTGEHATTRGCLLAIDRLAKRRHRRRSLDMGTGTGILAIAAAKTWRRRVWARDIDAEAVRVAAHNAGINGVARLLDLRRGNGYGDRGLRRSGPFDLILANILARPLMRMAPALARALAPGGVAVLSGLLARQEAALRAAHRQQGLALVRRIALDGWHTLVLAKRPLREDG